MSVGFDRSNLAHAAKVLVSVAKDRSQSATLLDGGTVRTFDLATDAGATEFLMAAAKDVYSRSRDGVAGQILSVVYYSIGVVFEVAAGEIHPPPLTRAGERPAHLAFFWQAL